MKSTNGWIASRKKRSIQSRNERRVSFKTYSSPNAGIFRCLWKASMPIVDSFRIKQNVGVCGDNFKVKLRKLHFEWFILYQHPFEPAHEVMALFVLLKVSLQTRMRSHPVGLDIWFLVGPFVYFHTSCVRTAKALARLCACAGSPEPSPVAYAISTIISWAGSFISYQDDDLKAGQSALTCTCTIRILDV